MRRWSLLDRLLGLPPVTTGKVRVHANLAVPMRDGVVLRADRYAPDAQPDAPVVLLRTPYGRRRLWRRLYCRPLAARGYQVVIQSCRGTEDSGGRFTPFDERQDGQDTVAWLRGQPWYPGCFAAFGPSYWGLSQWALADSAPEDLVAMVAVLTSARLVRSLFVGGAFSLQTWLGWSAVIAAQEDRRPGLAAVRRARGRKVARALQHLPVGEADEVAVGRPLGWWQEWVAHPDPDDRYWQRLDYASAVSTATVPVAMVTSWHDLFLPWQLADWTELPASAVPRRLVIAPWVHEDLRLFRLYLREALAWLDAQVRGGGRSLASGPVRYYLTGAKQWRDAAAWPPPGTVQRRWFLQHDGGLSTAEPEPGQPSRYRYDPADPTPALGGPTSRGNPRVRQDRVEARPDVLVFTTDALAAPVEVVGPVGARMYLRSSVEHTDVVVRLCDMDARGRSVNVCDGICRVTPWQGAADAQGVRVMDVDLWPTGHRFDRGHRIRVQVASAAFPRFARNPGTGEPPATATRLLPPTRRSSTTRHMQATSRCPRWQGHECSGRAIGRPRGLIPWRSSRRQAAVVSGRGTCGWPWRHGRDRRPTRHGRRRPPAQAQRWEAA
jgi:putative CocE/NonD family hydrolase